MISDPSDVAEFIKRLRTDLDELKAAQRFGYDSLLTYKTSSAASYDISATLADFTEVKEYDITFTHDQAEHGALLVMNPYWRFANPAVIALPIPRAVQSKLVTWMKLSDDNTSTTWRLRLASSFTVPTTFYVKLFFDGTDTGTFIVTPL